MVTGSTTVRNRLPKVDLARLELVLGSTMWHKVDLARVELVLGAMLLGGKGKLVTYAYSITATA